VRSKHGRRYQGGVDLADKSSGQHCAFPCGASRAGRLFLLAPSPSTLSHSPGLIRGAARNHRQQQGIQLPAEPAESAIAAKSACIRCATTCRRRRSRFAKLGCSPPIGDRHARGEFGRHPSGRGRQFQAFRQAFKLQLAHVSQPQPVPPVNRKAQMFRVVFRCLGSHAIPVLPYHLFALAHPSILLSSG